MASETKVVVLVGGGHAHAQVIKEYNSANRPEWCKVILIDPLKSASYSGMVPGAVSGQYSPEQTQIHLEPLAHWGGIEYINAIVVDIDPATRTLHLGASPYTGNEDVPKTVTYDVVSFDIGCRTAHTDVPGVTEHAIATRPIHLLVTRIQERVQAVQGESLKLVVCGAGAAGVELAMTAAVQVRNASKLPQTVLINSQSCLLPNDPKMVQDAAHKMVLDRDISIINDVHVTSVNDSVVNLSNGSSVSYDIVIWPTGAASHAVAQKLGEAGVSISDRGWIRVSSCLQSISHPNIFAAGDCCTFEGLANQPGKAGVYAVRTGPVLIHNLLGFLRDEALQDYSPQDEFLRLFNCGDGFGLGIRFGIPMYGEWVWQWKDFIDQWFMDLFKQENLPDISTLKGSDRSQFDAALRATVSCAPDDPTEASRTLGSVVADLQLAKDIVNRMSSDDKYRMKVCQAFVDNNQSEYLQSGM